MKMSEGAMKKLQGIQPAWTKLMEKSRKLVQFDQDVSVLKNPTISHSTTVDYFATFLRMEK